MAEYKDITYEVGTNAVRITINRPEVFNAFRTQTVEELILAFRRADEERSVNTVIFSGAGDKAFCTGGDQKVHLSEDGLYGPRGMVLVIVGAVAATQAVEIARAALGDWQNPAQPTAPTLPPLATIGKVRRVDTLVPGKSQSDLLIGVPGPARRDADYRAATLANSIFGQFGMMGRIGDVVREQMGLAYYAYSSLEGGQGPGAWSVNAGVNPQNVERAIEAIRAEIALLIAEPVTEEELADNQAYFTGILPLQLESNEGLAGTILNIETYDLGLDYLLTVRDHIRALTREDLLAAARHYWKPDALVISVAGPNGG